jgi:DNA-binding beta-propeller fold protein YncE
MKNFKLAFLLALTALASCKPTEDDPEPQPTGAYSKGVWFLNEGLFSSGNASVDFYKPESNEHEENVFKNVNQRPLGDVLQSMTLYEGRYYAVINNSQKIEVADAKDFKSVGAIEGLPSPRYMLPISPSKAYVSDFYARGITIINPTALSKTGKIDLNSAADTTFHDWTEQMVREGDEVFVCAPIKEWLYVMNVNTDKVTDTIKLVSQPQWMVVDKNKKIWVLASAYNRASQLFRIDPVSNTIEKQLTLTNPATSASSLSINAAGDELYFIYKDVYKMNIADADVPAQPFIPANGKSLYGLGVNPENGDVYVGDAADFTQKGSVIRYKSDGTLINTIPAGFLPRGFVFVK